MKNGDTYNYTYILDGKSLYSIASFTSTDLYLKYSQIFDNAALSFRSMQQERYVLTEDKKLEFSLPTYFRVVDASKMEYKDWYLDIIDVNGSGLNEFIDEFIKAFLANAKGLKLQSKENIKASREKRNAVKVIFTSEKMTHVKLFVEHTEKIYIFNGGATDFDNYEPVFDKIIKSLMFH